MFTLERNMNKLFESKEKVTAIPDESNISIQFHDTPYISYQEINLTQNFDIYFSGILRSRTALRMGVLISPYQQLFEMNAGAQSLKVLFKGAQRQLEWIEISLVYDKSYQHQTTYDSYDVELAAKFIQNVQLENASSTYSLTGQIFIAHNCDGCSTAALTQYKNNEIYQEITKREDYGGTTKDDCVYIDMRKSKGYTDELEKLTRDDIGVNFNGQS